VSLVNARQYLESASTLLSYGPDRYEFCVAEIHAAVVALDSLIGRIDVESVLDEIFSSFCLGK
jgi:tRNA modification GTPase